MNKLSVKIIRLVLPICLLALMVAFCVAYAAYWIAILAFLLLVFFVYKLYVFNLKTVNQLKLFTDSIRFSEHNLVFTNDISDSIYQEYYDSLSQAILKINEQTHKREVDIQFFTHLLNRIDFALIIADRNGQIVWVNRFALDLLGRPQPVSLQSLENHSEELRSVFNELQPKSSRLLKYNHRGKVRNLIANLSVMTLGGNELRVYSLKDVRPAVEKAEDFAWQQLIRVLTHEMMNSLTPIISLSESLSEGDNDPEVINRAIQTIYRRSKGLLDFVSSYKKLTQIPMPQRVSIEVGKLIEEVVGLMKGTGVTPSVFVTTDRLQVYADQVQMEQVLINLIKNAQEACADHPTPAIKITATDSAYGQVIITISDNGDGMDEETLGKIFTPFYTTKPNGSGIGLSICRQIITMHGGTLTAESWLGKGSVFTIGI